MRKSWGPLAILAGAILLVAGCGKKDDKIVAEVGARKISAGQLLIEYQAITPPNRPPFGTLEQKKAFLDILIAKEILSDEASARQLDKRPNVEATMLGFEEQQTFKEIFNEKGDKLVTVEPAEIEEYYKKSAAQVHVFAIWTDKDKEAADAALKEIRGGADFAAVAKKYTKNQYATVGGDMGWMSRSAPTIALFGDGFAAMKVGDVSDVILTPAGYYIVHLAEEKPAEMADFDAMKIAMRTELRQKKANRLWQEYADGLKAQANLVPVAENVAMVRERARQVPQTEVLQFTDQEKALPLVNYNGGAWTVGDLVFFTQSAGPSFRPALGDTNFMAESWMTNRAVSRVILKAARDLGLDKSPDVLARLKRKREELMIEELHQDLIKDVAVTEEDKRAYYEAKRDSMRSNPGATVRLIMASNQARIDSAYAEVQAGKAFEKVVERFSEDATKEKGGLVDTLLQGQVGEMDQAIFSLAPGEYSKPIMYQPTAHFIFLMVKKWEGRPLTYEETQAQIESALRLRKQNEAFDAWLAEKRKSLDIKVHDDALHAIMAEETGEGGAAGA